MCLASLYSLVQLIVKSLSYSDIYLFDKSERARSIYFYTLTFKFVFETLIVSLFIYQMRQLYLIKKRTSEFTFK